MIACSSLSVGELVVSRRRLAPSELTRSHSIEAMRDAPESVPVSGSPPRGLIAGLVVALIVAAGAAVALGVVLLTRDSNGSAPADPLSEGRRRVSYGACVAAARTLHPRPPDQTFQPFERARFVPAGDGVVEMEGQIQFTVKEPQANGPLKTVLIPTLHAQNYRCTIYPDETVSVDLTS